MMSSNLAGLKILITRPVHQSERLCQLITAQGGQPIRLPTIEIVEVADKSALFACCQRLDELDIVIFISTNAVEKTLPILLTQRALPPALQVIAVGKSTAETLNAWGIPALCAAPPFNSEAVLAMSQLQAEVVTGKKIVIFRGEGGRELLADTLRQRGATVDYVSVYCRTQPSVPEWAIQPVDIITITSREGLQNLLTMLEGQAWVRQTPLVVMSQRILSAAQKLGVQAPIFVAPQASDEGLVAGLLQAAQQVVNNPNIGAKE
jgi:uroporphyrinogen-III synthase